MKRFFIAVCTFIFSLSVFAYDYETLRKAMFDNNPELMTLQEEYNRSQLDVKDAYSGLGPTVDLLISGTYMLNPPVDAIYLNVDDILNSIQWPGGSKPGSTGQYVKLYDGMENTLYNFQLSVTQPIFTWGKLTNAISLYNQISDIKLTQVESKQQQLETELKTRLISLKYLEKINEIIEEEKTYADRLVAVSENAEKSGMLLHQDVVDARIQAKELEIAQQDLHEQINNQFLELQRSTGIENLSFELLEYDLNENSITEIMAGDRASMEEKALSGENLSIKLLTQLKEMNQTAKKIAEGAVNWKPDVALQATLGYGGSRFPLAEPNWLRKDEYTANFSLGIKTTVWDGGKKIRDVSRRVSEAKTADINQLDARSTIKKTLNEQWNTADVCTMKIEYQDLKLEATESKIKQKETVFQTGYGSETDVLNAKIERCNQRIEKEKQSLTRAAACMTIEFLCK
ncbi:MAG: TolC family protein [Treponema sp.]|nr:TolC family protein [Treponema sp.]